MQPGTFKSNMLNLRIFLLFIYAFFQLGKVEPILINVNISWFNL